MTRSSHHTAADALRPTIAERARTVATRPAAAVCAAGIDGCRVLGHAVTAEGDVLLVVPTDGEVATAVRHARDGDLAALVMVTDHAPVRLREPVRAQVWLSGWLTPVEVGEERAAAVAFAEVTPVGDLLDVGRGTSLLRMDLAEVALGEGGAVAELTPEAFLAADPDPLVEVEAAVLQHMDAEHRAELALLRSRLPASLLGESDVVRPLGLDRCGFRLRIEQPRGHQDVRVPFAAPISDAEQLAPAVHGLLCAARGGCPGR
jgi:hypothetical protein